MRVRSTKRPGAGAGRVHRRWMTKRGLGDLSSIVSTASVRPMDTETVWQFLTEVSNVAFLHRSVVEGRRSADDHATFSLSVCPSVTRNGDSLVGTV